MLQMLHIKQQIKRHAVLFQHLEAAQDFRTHNEIIIRLVLCDVADADKLRVFLKLEQLLLACLAGQIHPADHAHKPVVLLRHAQHPASFLEVMLRLHKDAFCHAGGIKMRPQVRR